MSGHIPANPPFTFPITGRIRVDILSLVLLAPATALLGLILFPALAPELPATSYWFMTTAALAATVVSIALRAVVVIATANFLRIPVDCCSLYLFGPALFTSDRQGRPAAESLVATVHLLTLVLLTAGSLWIFANGFSDALSIAPLGVALFLAAVHAGLFLFYLLPGYPLDGGRFLRAILMRRKSPTPASQRAAKITYVLAGILVIGGAVLALSVAPYGGLAALALGAMLALAASGVRHSL